MKSASNHANSDCAMQYNVGVGPVYKWDPSRREMRPWQDVELKA